MSPRMRIGAAATAVLLLAFAGPLADRVIDAVGARTQHTTVGFGVVDPEQVAGGVTFGERVAVVVENGTESGASYTWRTMLNGDEIDTGTVVVAGHANTRFTVTAPEQRGTFTVELVDPARTLHWQVGP